MKMSGEAESGSAGTQLDEEWPDRRCAEAPGPLSGMSAGGPLRLIAYPRPRTPSYAFENPGGSGAEPPKTSALDANACGMIKRRFTWPVPQDGLISQQKISSSPHVLFGMAAADTNP